MKRQTIKRLVRLLLSFGRPLRGRFSIRTPRHHPAATATAAFPAIQCRCGRTFPCRSVLTVFQGGFTVGQDSATAAFPSIRCRCGRRVVGRRSRPGHLRLRRSHFAMSSISLKFISLIIKDIHFKNLLDPAYFATKRPFCPISSQVQQMSFSRTSDYQAFL
jgi:hypothetical protein